MANHLFVVLANSKPGLDAELNRWYDEEHLAEVVAHMPGAIGACRYALADLPDRPAHPYRYIAVYEIEEGHLEEAYAYWMAERSGRAGTDLELAVPLDNQTLASGFFRPTGPVIRSGGSPG